MKMESKFLLEGYAMDFHEHQLNHLFLNKMNYTQRKLEMDASPRLDHINLELYKQ